MVERFDGLVKLVRVHRLRLLAAALVEELALDEAPQEPGSHVARVFGEQFAHDGQGLLRAAEPTEHIRLGEQGGSLVGVTLQDLIETPQGPVRPAGAEGLPRFPEDRLIGRGEPRRRTRRPPGQRARRRREQFRRRGAALLRPGSRGKTLLTWRGGPREVPTT